MKIFEQNKLLLQKIGILSDTTESEQKRLKRNSRIFLILTPLSINLTLLIGYCLFGAETNFEKMKESLFVIGAHIVVIGIYLLFLGQEANLKRILEDAHSLVNNRKEIK